MNVNKERLEELIDSAIVCCEDCPLYKVDDWSLCDEYCQRIDEDTSLQSCNCKDILLKWLCEFDVTEALEQGAHIVNDRILFPPKEMPVAPFYDVPCEAHHCEGLVSTLCCDCLFDPFEGFCPYR